MEHFDDLTTEDGEVSSRLNLGDFSIEELIEWRNKASNRVNANDQHIIKLYAQIEKTEKVNSKDLRWISKINRHLNKVCFGYRSKIYQGESNPS
jgi:hypothetical protein